MSRRLLGYREYAAHRKAAGLVGTTLRSVQKAVETNRISTVTDEKGRTKIDPEVADIQWSRNTDGDQSMRANSARLAAGATMGNETPSGSATVSTAGAQSEDGANGSRYWDAKTRREIAAAEKEELQLEELRGNLVSRAEVRRAGLQAGRLLRDMIMSVPTKVAGELAALTDTAEVERRLREELRKPLEQIERIALAETAKPRSAD